MNFIQIKQVGNLQSNLNSLSDSIYETGQYLLVVNDGPQTYEGEKTFGDEAFFNTGVRVFGTLTGQAAIFNEGIEVAGIITQGGNPIPSFVAVPPFVGSAGSPGMLAYSTEHLYCLLYTSPSPRD